MLRAWLVTLGLLVSCGSDQEQSAAPGPAPSETPTGEGVPSSGLTQDVVVSGALALPDGVDVSTLEGRRVDLKDQAGNTLASGYSGSDGAFSISAGNIAIDAEVGALLGSGHVIESVLEDDGDGNVLAVNQSVDLTSAVGGIVDAGKALFAEVSAIKGQIKFVNPDGSENETLAKMGADVFLPGFSFFARTAYDGSFLILYVPADTYDLRIEKGAFSYETDVTVEAQTTLNLGTVSIQTDTEAPTTSASVDSRDFRNPFCVTLSADETSNIYYSVDGSTPLATNAFKYNASSTTSCGSAGSCAICVSESTTIKYFAVDSAGNAEDQKSKFYYYNERWDDPSDTTAPTLTVSIDQSTVSTLSTPSTTYQPVVFELSASEGSDIYYTTASGSSTPSDPSTDTTGRKKYTGPITIKSTTTLRFYAVDYARNASSIQSHQVVVLNWQRLTVLAEPLAAAKARVLYSPSLGTAVLIGQTYNTTPTYTRVYVYNEDLAAGSQWVKVSECQITSTSCPKMLDARVQTDAGASRFLDRMTILEGTSGNPDTLLGIGGFNSHSATFRMTLPATKPTAVPGSLLTWTINKVDDDNDGNEDAADRDSVPMAFVYYDRYNNKVYGIDGGDMAGPYYFVLNASTGFFARNASGIDMTNATSMADTSRLMCQTVVQSVSGNSSAATLLIMGQTTGTTSDVTVYDAVFSTAYASGGGSMAKDTETSYPTAAYGCSISYDPAYSLALSFGGAGSRSSSSPNTLSDLNRETWIYRNSGGTWTWSQVNPQTVPAARALASIAYIPELEGHLMVGGVSPSIATASEVWLFGK